MCTCYPCGLTLNKSSKFLVVQPLQVHTQALAYVHQSATVNYKPHMQKLPMCGCKVFPLNIVLLWTEMDDMCVMTKSVKCIVLCNMCQFPSDTVNNGQ